MTQTLTNPYPTPFNHIRSEILAGARDTIPLVVGAIPFGVIFGTLALNSGLSFWGTLAMSAFVFAGSAQFIAIGLLAIGTSWPIIVLTTLVVNLRHLLYSVTLIPAMKHLSQQWQIPLAFWLTDETFAVVVKRYQALDGSNHKQWYHLGSSLAMYLNWQLCTLIGLTMGQLFPDIASWGLEFAMPVTFIGMTIPYLKNKPMWAAVIVAGAVALMTYSMPHKIGLMIAALAGVTTGFIVETVGKTDGELNHD